MLFLGLGTVSLVLLGHQEAAVSPYWATPGSSPVTGPPPLSWGWAGTLACHPGACQAACPPGACQAACQPTWGLRQARAT